MRENRRNPSGYGHSAPDTASLLQRSGFRPLIPIITKAICF